MVCFEIWHEFDSPATLYLSTGNLVMWLRYSEWLLCCPVSALLVVTLLWKPEWLTCFLVSDAVTITMTVGS